MTVNRLDAELDMQAKTLIADKTLNRDESVIERLAAAGKTTVIPPKAIASHRGASIGTSIRRAILSRTSSPSPSNSTPSRHVTTRGGRLCCFRR